MQLTTINGKTVREAGRRQELDDKGRRVVCLLWEKLDDQGKVVGGWETKSAKGDPRVSVHEGSTLLWAGCARNHMEALMAAHDPGELEGHRKREALARQEARKRAEAAEAKAAKKASGSAKSEGSKAKDK